MRKNMETLNNNMHWLSEQLKTIRNLTEIADILIILDKQTLLPTVLEYIFLEAQDITDSYCVVNDGE